MTHERLDIVNLIENNPLEKLKTNSTLLFCRYEKTSSFRQFLTYNIF